MLDAAAMRTIARRLSDIGCNICADTADVSIAPNM